MPPKRLRAAMEDGYLNARCRRRDELLRTYGRWCWRMGLPLVWFEPRSPYSRTSRVHLDLFTTPLSLSVRGRAELIALSARYTAAKYASISSYSGVWDRLAPGDAALFARAIFRIVRRAGNYEIAKRPEAVPAGPKVVPFRVARQA